MASFEESERLMRGCVGSDEDALRSLTPYPAMVAEPDTTEPRAAEQMQNVVAQSSTLLLSQFSQTTNTALQRLWLDTFFQFLQTIIDSKPNLFAVKGGEVIRSLTDFYHRIDKWQIGARGRGGNVGE